MSDSGDDGDHEGEDVSANQISIFTRRDS